MKRLFLLAAISLGLFSCTPSGGNQDKDSIDLVKNYIKAVEARDYEAMSKCLDDNYLGMGPSFGDSVRKEEAVAHWKAYSTNLYEKIEYTRSRFANVTIPEGDNKGTWVANWAELTIRYKNGKGPITIWANTNYQIENGKIIKSITFYNEADALRQLGYQLVAPETDK
jgi:ketosteroid isomerase-like protein